MRGRGCVERLVLGGLQEALDGDARLADVAQPLAGVLVQAALEQRAHGPRGVGRQARPRPDRGPAPRPACRRPSCRDARPCRSASPSARRRAPRCRRGGRRLAAGLLGAHVGGGPEHHARLRSHPGHRRRERSRIGGSSRIRLGIERLGQPEVEDLDLPSGVSLTLAGLRSRWMMPRSWASSRPRRSAARSRAPRRRSRPARCAPAESRPRRAPSPGSAAGPIGVGLLDRWMPAMLGWFSEASSWPRGRSGPSARRRWRTPPAAA